MKNYNQSKKAKDEFLRKSALACYMKGKQNQLVTKEELQEQFFMTNRALRLKIAEMANYIPVVSLSSNTGYKVVGFDDSTSTEDLVAMYEEIQHQINDFKSRIDNLKARMKPLVALQKVIEKRVDIKLEETKE